MKKFFLIFITITGLSWAGYRYVYLPHVLRWVGEFSITNKDRIQREAVLKITEPESQSQALAQLVEAYRNAQILINHQKPWAGQLWLEIERIVFSHQDRARHKEKIKNIFDGDELAYQKIFLWPYYSKSAVEQSSEKMRMQEFNHISTMLISQLQLSGSRLRIPQASSKKLVVRDHVVTWSDFAKPGESTSAKPGNESSTPVSDELLLRIQNELLTKRRDLSLLQNQFFQVDDCWVFVMKILLQPHGKEFYVDILQPVSLEEWLKIEQARVPVF